MKNNKIFRNVFIEFKNLIKELNKLIPGIVLILVSIISIIIWIALQSEILMMGIVVLIVLLSSIVIYSSTRNYGESALALVAGLLTAYTVNWNMYNFILFVASWSFLTIIVFIISSINIASRKQEILNNAAIAIGNGKYKENLKKFSNIEKLAGIKMLGPIEKAEIIQSFSFRKLSFDYMVYGMKMIEILFTTTKINHIELANFVVDIYKFFPDIDVNKYNDLLDLVYHQIRNSPVSPNDYLSAFNNCRRFVITHNIESEIFLESLTSALQKGFHPSEVADYIEF